MFQGHVFEDTDADGVRASFDTGFAGRRIWIDANVNGRYDTGEPSQVTQIDGSYQFSNLASGNYTLVTDPASGFRVSTPLTVAVTLDNQFGRRLVFGFYRQGGIAGRVVDVVDYGFETPPITYRGASGIRVGLDVNSNSQIDPAEPLSITDSEGR